MEYERINLFINKQTLDKFRTMCGTHKLIPHRVAVLMIEKFANSVRPANWIKKAHKEGVADSHRRTVLNRKKN